MSPLLLFTPQDVTPYFVLIASFCGALTGLSAVAAGAYVIIPKTNKKAEKWFHEFTGAGPALRATEQNTEALKIIGTQLETFGKELAANREEVRLVDEKVDERHEANSKELGALSGNLERTATALMHFTDESTAEADMRNQALIEVGNLARTTAEELKKHTSARSRHLSPRKHGQQPA